MDLNDITPIELRRGTDRDTDDQVTLFRHQGREYKVRRHLPASIFTDAVELTEEHGEYRAGLILLEQLMGEETYAYLHANADVDELQDVSTLLFQVIAGAVRVDPEQLAQAARDQQNGTTGKAPADRRPKKKTAANGSAASSRSRGSRS